jgi:hypothetical protein
MTSSVNIQAPLGKASPSSCPRVAPLTEGDSSRADGQNYGKKVNLYLHLLFEVVPSQGDIERRRA